MNNEIINILEKGGSLTNEHFDYIKTNYKRVDENAEGKWFKVCRPGNDYKYGRFMIDPYKHESRSLTFDEFYGGGIVD